MFSPKSEEAVIVREYNKEERFIHGLDGLRFFAAVWLYWEHMFWDFPSINYLSSMQYRGQVPLQYFFLMGGMVLYAAYFKSRDFSTKATKANFWLGRLARVGPNYYLALFLQIPTVIFDIWYRSNSVGWTSWDIFNQVYGMLTVPLMLQGWVLPNEMAFAPFVWSPLLWAMSPFAFYWFLFPWLVRFVEKDRTHTRDFIYLTISYVLAVLPFLILYLVASIPAWMGNEPVLSCTDCIYWWLREFPPLRITSQLIGMFLAKIWINTSASTKKSIFIGLAGDIAFISTIVCSLFIPFEAGAGVGRGDDHDALLDTILSPLQCMTMFALACRKGILSKILSLKPLVYCGKISFGIWAYQFCARYIFAYFSAIDWWISLIGFFMLVGCAIISLELYETETRKKILSLRRYFPAAWRSDSQPI